MKPTRINTVDFVLAVMQWFAHAQMAIWLSGGWAEEFWGLCPPKQHGDVDLLYPAPNFHRLDHWLSHTPDLSPIEGKRFSHKRAVLYEQVMIEVVLLEPQSEGYVTHYFDHRYTLIWPHDTLSHLLVGGYLFPVASCQALKLHRQHYPQIAQAYQSYLQEQSEI